ncbi:MAG: acyl-CoA dehydrogenase, partial [Burkholderiales bacterium]
MDFEYSAKTQELQTRVRQFMDENVYPNEQAVRDEMDANTKAGKRWTPLETINKQKKKAKAAGLWNLFLPVDSAHASGYDGA